jgi:hypothetical protein
LSGFQILVTYNALVEIVGAASMASGYLGAEGCTATQKELSLRCKAAVDSILADFELMDEKANS